MAATPALDDASWWCPTPMAAARPVALAGMMGGHDTRVTDATRNVFLEAAHSPRGDHGPRPQARPAYRCRPPLRARRGPELAAQAIEYATRLVIGVGRWLAGPVTEAVLPPICPAAAIILRRARIARVLGMEIADAEVERILRALGMQVGSAPKAGR
jgi:phenylalanyl-tRNA synthetase beta chain